MATAKVQLNDRELNKLGEAYLETIDKLYGIAEWARIDQSWVQEMAYEIQAKIKETTGIEAAEL